MKIGSIIAFENVMGETSFGEIIDSDHIYWNGERGITVMTFEDNLPQFLFESDCWLLADNL
jgi:hypothetical protein